MVILPLQATSQQQYLLEVSKLLVNFYFNYFFIFATLYFTNALTTLLKHEYDPQMFCKCTIFVTIKLVFLLTGLRVKGATGQDKKAAK